MDKLGDRNNTSYQHKLDTVLARLAEVKDDPLQYHQRVAHDYLIGSGVRGILAKHGLGSGKTILAVSVCEDMIRNDPDYNVMIVASKSLHSNMRSGIAQYTGLKGAELEDHIAKNYNFVASNASNMMKQVNKAVAEDWFGDVAEQDLEHTMLIIDEAHDFFNSISNGSKNAVAMYRKIMAAKKIKLLFLTGSPIVNDPYEIALCYNMLAGEKIFPEDYTVFNRLFVTRSSGGEDDDSHMVIINNAQRFAERIVGLTSSYNLRDPEMFPKSFPLDIIDVPMSSEQYGLYTVARKREIEEAKKKFLAPRGNPMFKPASSGGSTYNVLSRQISNVKYPEGTYTLHKNDKGGLKYEKHPEKITAEHLDDVRSWGPKIAVTLDIVYRHAPEGAIKPEKSGKGKTVKIPKRSETGVGLIYSQFKGSGIHPVALLLEHRGMARYNPEEGKKNVMTYAIVSGDIDTDERRDTIAMFNSDENIRGAIISVLLITGTGAQGLDTQNSRYQVIMEPYWHWTRTEQIMGRGDRYKSHLRLKPEERTTRSYLLVATYPVGLTKGLPETEPTINEKLMAKSLQNKILIDSFRTTLDEASIDCSLWTKKNCRACRPTNRKLFSHDIVKDIYEPSPCEKPEERTVKVKSITVETPEGKKEFKYDADHIYVLDESVGGYIVLPSDDRYYKMVRDLIPG